MLDQFLAVLANMLRPNIRVGLLRFLRSLLLFDLGTGGSRLLASFFLVCVFSLSFTSFSTTLVSWLLSLSSLRCVVSSRHFAARRFLGCLVTTQPSWSLRSSGSLSLRVVGDHGFVGLNLAGCCVYDGALSYNCARPLPEEAWHTLLLPAAFCQSLVWVGPFHRLVIADLSTFVLALWLCDASTIG